MEHLARRVAEQPLRGPVPGTDLAALGDRVRRVRGLLEQREQLRFEHRSPHDLTAGNASASAPGRPEAFAHRTRVSLHGTNASLSPRGSRHNYAPVCATQSQELDIHKEIQA